MCVHHYLALMHRNAALPVSGTLARLLLIRVLMFPARSLD
jgi:hypothetical protein